MPGMHYLEYLDRNDQIKALLILRLCDGRCFSPPLTLLSVTKPQSSFIKSEPFSAIMMVGALMLPDTMLGMMDASITLNPSIPWTRNRGLTTDVGSEAGPILALPD